ncbi:MAG: 50S ribosomal protein L17 [Patescibacteria group bacterium]|nr:50S ribosomal protein L17 [Patescibacteria group bacterium]
MRHRNEKKTLDRPRSQRVLLRRNMAVSLVEAEHMVTTLAKAKWLRPFFEHLVTIAKKQNLASHRQLISLLNNKKAARKLMSEIAIRFANRSGGFVRIIKAGIRQGDGARMAVIELLDRSVKDTAKSKVKKPKSDQGLKKEKGAKNEKDK